MTSCKWLHACKQFFKVQEKYFSSPSKNAAYENKSFKISSKFPTNIKPRKNTEKV